MVFSFLDVTIKHFQEEYKASCIDNTTNANDDRTKSSTPLRPGRKPKKIKSKRFVCDQCDRSYTQASTLNKHKQIIHQMINPHICDICNAKFPLYLDIKQHMRIHADANDALENAKGIEYRDYACDLCEKCYRTRRFLIRHKRHVHERIRPYVCKVCNMCFAENTSLRKHAQRHTGVKQYQCHICLKHFTTNFEKGRHIIAVHQKIRAWKCDLCTKDFARKSDLRTHKRMVHERIRKFICDMCDRSFYDKTSLKYHLTTHAKYKKYGCDQCRRRFGYLRSLRNHKIKNHP